MAKKTRKDMTADTQPAGITMTAAAEARLENFADDLGTLLGQAQNKAESWLGQRKSIAEQLMGVRDTAARLLAQLGVAEAPKVARGAKKAAGTGRPAAKKTGVKKKRTMSAEAREKIAAAQRARWAKQKKARD